MLAITHGLTGGFLASKITSPLIAYPAALLAHLLMDKIPHWDFGVISKKTRYGYLFWGTIDLTITLILVWQLFSKKLFLSPFIWGGVFFGLLPDFIEVPFYVFRFQPFLLKQFNRVHTEHKRSKKFSILKGLLPQAIIIGFILLFL